MAVTQLDILKWDGSDTRGRLGKYLFVVKFEETTGIEGGILEMMEM